MAKHNPLDLPALCQAVMDYKEAWSLCVLVQEVLLDWPAVYSGYVMPASVLDHQDDDVLACLFLWSNLQKRKINNLFTLKVFVIKIYLYFS